MRVTFGAGTSFRETERIERVMRKVPSERDLVVMNESCYAATKLRQPSVRQILKNNNKIIIYIFC